MTPGVLVLTGPTASGKSGLALALAERFDAEIVGADSRQIYRGMPIGTAAPDAISRARVPHHLIEFLDPRERYIVESRMMADPEEELSLAEIGRRLGVSRERARQLEARAKKKLRDRLLPLAA